MEALSAYSPTALHPPSRRSRHSSYEVFVPSGDQTGIKTDQGFSVPVEGADVALVFDENASLANVTATGNGKVILAPVLRVKNQQ